MQVVFKWASAAFAIIPGLLIILTNIGSPPFISNTLMGGIVEATGCISLILIQLNKEWINSLSISKITKISIACLIVFLLSVITYMLIFNHQVIHSSEFNKDIFFPFWYGEELTYMMNYSHSKLNVIHDFGPDAINDAVTNSTPYLQLTILIFILLYVTIFEMLVIAFGLPGFKINYL